MKRNIYYIFLAAEMAACAILALVQASFSGALYSALAFPFEQIGLGLRALSLSGGLGNAAAIVIYALLSLSPLAALPLLGRRRKLMAEDGLLGLLSLALFACLYLMVNPALIGAPGGGAVWQSTGKAVLGSVIYSVLCGYFILRALRVFFHSNAPRLILYMQIMLKVLGVFFTYLACGACFSKLLHAMTALKASNAGNENLLGASYVFLLLQFAVDALPYVLDTLVVLAALRLLCELLADRYSSATLAATDRMTRLCAGALIATVLVNISFNVLQLLFAEALRVVNVSLNIPLFSIVFVLSALLLTRFVAESKKIKDDNDMFI
jgi:hypothetical protein